MEMCTEFLAHLEEHPAKHIYTDGSKIDQHMGFSAVFHDDIYS